MKRFRAFLMTRQATVATFLVLALTFSPAVMPVLPATSGSPGTSLFSRLTALIFGSSDVADAEIDAYSATVLADNPSAYFRLGETSGSIVQEASGRSGAGTYSTATMLGGVGAIAGDSNTSVTRGADSSIFTAPSSTYPSGSASRTYEVWLKTNDGAPNEIFSYNNMALAVVDNSLSIWTPAARLANLPLPQGVAIADNTWHHVVVAYDAAAHRITGYLDGASVGINDGVTIADSGPSSAGTAVSRFSGSVDELALYPGVLSPERVAAHWTRGQSSVTACAPVPTTTYASVVLADGPSGYYRLSEAGSGRVAFDSSGRCLNGVLHSFTGSAGSAIAGDADASLSNVPQHTAFGVSSVGLPSGSASRTTEAWFRTTKASGDRVLAYNGFIVALFNNRLELWNPWNRLTAWDPIPGIVLNDGVWHHVALTYDSSARTVRLYVDGTLLRSYSDTTVTDTGANTEALSSNFDGEIDEVAVYSKVLSPAQINAHWTRGATTGAACTSPSASPYSVSVRSDNPSAYYRLGETAGRVAYDGTGRCSNGVIFSDTAPTAGAILGDPDGALSNLSNHSSFTASANGLPFGSANRTWEAWVRPKSSFGEDIVNFNGISVATFENRLELWSPSRRVANFSIPEGKIYDGQWHHIAVTYDGTSATTRAYVDNAEVGTYLNTDLVDGGASTGALLSRYNGDVDEVAVYPTALSAERIAAHYSASGHGAAPAGYPGGPGPIGGPRSAMEMAGGCTCGSSNNSDRGKAADPIDTGSGNFYMSFSDIGIGGRGQGLDLSRIYNAVAAATDSAFGYGWSNPYGAYLREDSTTGAVTISQENGSQIVFNRQGDGSYLPMAPRIVSTLTRNADATFTYVRSHATTFNFSSTGKLSKVTDVNGIANTLSYDAAGNVSKVTDYAGRSLTFTWTGLHITAVTDSTGRKVSYAYDTIGNLIKVTGVDGAALTYGYDAGHRLITVLDQAQATSTTPKPLTNVYDAQGRVIKQTDPLGRITSFTYNADNTTLVTESSGRKRLDTYWFGLRTAVTYGYGTTSATTTYFAYDPISLGVTATYTEGPGDPNRHASSATYDLEGNATSVTDSAGRTSTFTYNSRGQVLTVTAPNPSSVGPATITTTNTYDLRGNLTSTTTPVYSSATAFVNQTTTYVRGDANRPDLVTSVIDPAGKMTTNTYDAVGNLISTTTAGGRKVTYTYDALGRVLTTVAPKGNSTGATASRFTTTNTYDVAGRVLTTSTANGTTPNKTTNVYDKNGRLTSVTDAAGRRATFTYDLAGQQTSMNRPDGTKLQTTYFQDGSVSSQIDGAGRVTSYTLDALGRVATMKDPLGRITKYTYDAVGQLLTEANPSGQVTTHAYDSADQLVATKYSDGVTPNVSYTYNAAGARATMTDGTGTSSWSYDNLGRVTGHASSGGTVGYAYDIRNAVTKLTYPSGQAVTRTYGADGELTSVMDWAARKTTFAYDLNGALTTTVTPNGVSSTVTYNDPGQITATKYAKGTTQLGAITYTRNVLGELTAETPTGTGGTAQTYAYNTLGKLVTNGTKPLTYDTADNLTKNVDGSILAYDVANQVKTRTLGTAITNYSYDTRGNRISASGAQVATYGYDQESRLNRYVAGVKVTTYAYDGDGLRTSKTVAGAKTNFSYNTVEGLPLVLTDGTNSYLYGPSGTPFAQINSAGTVTYLHIDQLGSVRMLSSTTGTVAGTVNYDPYGKVTTKSGSTSPFGYAGQYGVPPANRTRC